MWSNISMEASTPQSSAQSPQSRSMSLSGSSADLDSVQRLGIDFHMGNGGYLPPQPAHGLDSFEQNMGSRCPPQMAFFNWSQPCEAMPTPVSYSGGSPPNMKTDCYESMDQSFNSSGSSSRQPSPSGTSYTSQATSQADQDWCPAPEMRHIAFNHSSPTMMQAPLHGHMSMYGHQGAPTHAPHGMVVSSPEQSHHGMYPGPGMESAGHMDPHMSMNSSAMFMPHAAPPALVRNHMMSSSSSPMPQPRVPMLPSESSHSMGMAPLGQQNYGTVNSALRWGEVAGSPPYSPPSNSATRGSRQRVPRPARRRPRNARAMSNRCAATTGTASPRRQSAASERSERLELAEDAAMEDKVLLQIRHLADGERGKGMWDKIVDEFANAGHQRKSRAALQMQLCRAVAEHGMWSTEECTLLAEVADEYDSKRRLPTILAMLKERGGCRRWDWTTRNVAKKLIEMGIDEPDMDDLGKLTKKRKSQLHRRARSDNFYDLQAATSGSGLAEPQRTLTPEQFGQLFDAFPDLDMEEEQQERDGEAGGSPGGGPLDEAAMEGVPEQQSGSFDAGQAQSQRVADRACQQYMSQQQQDQDQERPSTTPLPQERETPSSRHVYGKKRR